MNTTTSSAAYTKVLDALHQAGATITKDTGHAATATCPAHDDHRPSLSVGHRRDGDGAVVHCHAGCDTEDVLAALNLTVADLFDRDDLRRAYSSSREYRYPGGRVKHRAPGKRLWQTGNMADKSLYRADQLPDDPSVTILVVEGEKDCEAAWAVGAVAVSPHGGAGNAHLSDWTPLAGRRVIVVTDNDPPGIRHAEQVVELLAPIAASIKVKRASVGKDLADHVAAGLPIDDLVDIPIGGNPAVTELDDVQPEVVTWLWERRLPQGKLVIVDGDPGVGKSTLALTMAATVSTGGLWPDGGRAPQGTVLLMSAEDGLADTIVPRLLAAGADTTRIKALEGRTVITPAGVEVEPIDLLSPTIRDAIIQHDAKLLVIDVLMAFLPVDVNSNNDSSSRRVGRYLSRIAEETGCCIVLLRHLNKSGGGNPLYRGGGSIAWTGAARVGFIVARDPEDETLVCIAASKNNLSAPAPTIGYRLVDVPEYGCARVEFHNGTVGRSAADLLDAGGFDAFSEVSDAAAWLEGYLIEQGGRAGHKDVLAAAKQAGYSKAAVYRAAKRVATSITDIAAPGGRGRPPTVWCLKDHTPPPASKPSATPRSGVSILVSRTQNEEDVRLKSTRRNGASDLRESEAVPADFPGVSILVSRFEK